MCQYCARQQRANTELKVKNSKLNTANEILKRENLLMLEQQAFNERAEDSKYWELILYFGSGALVGAFFTFFTMVN